jgi:hypothetical protein
MQIFSNKIIVNGICSCRNCPNFEPNSNPLAFGKCRISHIAIMWYWGCYLMNGERVYTDCTNDATGLTGD